jgi:uncharacterized ferritin-like protein (DUF455 family)
MAILHALTHIEFNAFSSYVDTYLRFNTHVNHNYKDEFENDISQTALEEGNHFMLLSERLK